MAERLRSEGLRPQNSENRPEREPHHWRIATVVGEPGTGKSSIGELLAERLGWGIHESGAYFRERLGEEGIVDRPGTDELDIEIDSMVEEMMRKAENMVFMGRTNGVLTERSGQEDAFNVLVYASAPIKYERASKRGESMSAFRRRLSDERERFKRLYEGYIFSINAPHYHAVVRTDETTAEEVAEVIEHLMRTRRPGDKPIRLDGPDDIRELLEKEGAKA